MSFPQIANVETGRHCQVLLMSSIAAKKNVVLADPYPFIMLLVRSVLKPFAIGLKMSFVHRLLNQLMETIPDSYGLDILRQKMSDGIAPFFLDQSDVGRHRLAIVDHFICYDRIARPAGAEICSGELTEEQLRELMAMIPTALKRGAEQVSGEDRQDWMGFRGKCSFASEFTAGPTPLPVVGHRS